MKPIAAALLLLTPPGIALAQPGRPDPGAAQEKVAPLAMMVGKWKGEGWMTLPDGSRSEFLSTEEVTRELGDTILFVRGRHFDKVRPTQPVHDAMGIIAWDMRAQQLRMRTYLATGMSGDFPITATADGFSWTIEAPQMTIRYEASFAGGIWHETGSRSNDGKNWVKFLEMRLSRAQ